MKPEVRPCVQGITPYQPGKPVEEVERELGIRAIKLASNENPLGPSPKARLAARQALVQIALYPDGACFHLRQALAKKLGVRSQELILGNGSNELLVQLGMALLSPGDEVLTSENSFSVYATVPRLMDAKLVTVPMRDHTFDLEAMARAITPKTKLIFIANPNNPTGTVVDPKALQTFLAAVPPSCLVVLDEAYYEYVDPKLQGDSLAWVRARQNLAVLRTFSKAYGLAGLRVGYGVVPSEIAQAVDRVREPFNVNHVAQAAAQAALKDLPHVRRTVALARREQRRLTPQLKRLGFQVVPSQANFIYVGVPQVLAPDGRTFFERLLRLGVIIRPFGGAFVRITLGTVKENDRLLAAIRKLGPAIASRSRRKGVRA